jgi:hypothetical protein
MPDLVLLSVIAIVVLALVFDFTNGFHDAANSIATVVSTRVLTPRMAVIWARPSTPTWSPRRWSSPGWSGPSPGTS